MSRQTTRRRFPTPNPGRATPKTTAGSLAGGEKYWGSQELRQLESVGQDSTERERERAPGSCRRSRKHLSECKRACVRRGTPRDWGAVLRRRKLRHLRSSQQAGCSLCSLQPERRAAVTPGVRWGQFLRGDCRGARTKSASTAGCARPSLTVPRSGRDRADGSRGRGRSHGYAHTRQVRGSEETVRQTRRRTSKGLKWDPQ